MRRKSRLRLGARSLMLSAATFQWQVLPEAGQSAGDNGRGAPGILRVRGRLLAATALRQKEKRGR
jgi:hypothetical protein